MRPEKATIEVCFVDEKRPTMEMSGSYLWAKHFPRQELEESPPIYIGGDIMNYYVIAYGGNENGAMVVGMMNHTASKLLKHYPMLEFNGNFIVFRVFYGGGDTDNEVFRDLDISPKEFMTLVKAHFEETVDAPSSGNL